MTIRVGLIGCGLMGQRHLTGFQAAKGEAEVTIFCDDNLESARKLAGDQNQITSRWQDVIESDIDVVDICSPHYLHAPMVLAAAGAGKHVLLEKPMAMNLTEGRQMVEAVERAGKIFMVAQNQRYLPEHLRIKEMLDQEIIGRVFAARVDGNQFLSKIYPPGSWIFSKEWAGGGVVRTTAIHKIDILRYFLGEISRVASFQRSSGLNPGMDTEDVAVISLEFESGAIGEAFFTFAAYASPIKSATHELTVFYGDSGMISNVMGWHLLSTKVPEYSAGLTRLDLPDADYALSFIHEVRHFLDCVQTGQEPRSSGRDNLKTIAVVDAIYRSAETGQIVQVEY